MASTSGSGGGGETAPQQQPPHWPAVAFDTLGGQPNPSFTLKTDREIVLFTFLWTTVIFLVLFGAAGTVAAAVFWKRRLALPLLLGLVGFGVVSGAASGAVTGFALSLIYTYMNFPMPTWVPLAWAFAEGLVVIISSYSEVGLTTL